MVQKLGRTKEVIKIGIISEKDYILTVVGKQISLIGNIHLGEGEPLLDLYLRSLTIRSELIYIFYF